MEKIRSYLKSLRLSEKAIFLFFLCLYLVEIAYVLTIKK